MNSSSKESLYSSVVNRFSNDIPVLNHPKRSSQELDDFHFAMNCNGYALSRRDGWFFSSEAFKFMREKFTAQRVSFFGPGGGGNEGFFSDQGTGHELFPSAFQQDSVIKAIRKYRQIDENQAARVAFLLGGPIRHIIPSWEYPHDVTRQVTEFTAKMALLGGPKSGETIASAAGMYILSQGPVSEDREFTRNVYHMAGAIESDPIVAYKTNDLGLSQVARLRNFNSSVNGLKAKPFPDIIGDLDVFEGFPTVGAEFHFPLEPYFKNPDFLKRLMLLNMSQYHIDSYIQLSRNDRDVLEVRMNPSFWAATIANYQYIRRILPEVEDAFFTTTLNRQPLEDFKWDQDSGLLAKLRGLGMLTYASVYKDVPITKKPDEINFGTVYLGQTVRLLDGEFKYTGCWSNENKDYGQLGVYTGFGDNFNRLTYYLSMALANPEIMNYTFPVSLVRIENLHQALNLSPEKGKDFFNLLQRRIEKDEKLGEAYQTGNRIIAALSD